MRQLKITKQLTNRDSKSIDKYLSDVSKESMINAEEEVNLAVKRLESVIGAVSIKTDRLIPQGKWPYV